MSLAADGPWNIRLSIHKAWLDAQEGCRGLLGLKELNLGNSGVSL